MRHWVWSGLGSVGLIYLALAGGWPGTAVAQPATMPSQVRGLPLLLIPRALEPVEITADLNDPVWQGASVVALGDPSGRKTPELATEVRAVGTEAGLYLAFRCQEPDIDRLVTDKLQIWQRDSVEIFIEPEEDLANRPYHHLIIDAAGQTLLERGHLYTRYFRLKAFEERWQPAVKPVVGKSAGQWVCAVRLAWDDLHLTAAAREGGLWRMNFCRTRPGRDKGEDSYWSWSPLGGGFQTPTRFGYAIPAVFASATTERRLAALPATAPADPSAAAAAAESTAQQVDTLMKEVVAGGKPEATKALQAMAYQGEAMYRLVEGRGQEAYKGNAGRSGLNARTFLYELGRDRPEEDPVPASVRAVIDRLEPRRQMDSAGNSLAYRIMKPLKQEAGQKYPLVVFLHGSAECGSDNWRQLDGGALDYVSPGIQDRHPCFVLAPQCPAGSSWGDQRTAPGSVEAMRATSNYRLAERPGTTTVLLLAAIDTVLAENPAIDRQRIYVCGSSMGGFGTYELLMRRPEMFAAGMPLCGGGDETRAGLIAQVPIWIFHGAQDDRVKVQAARNMVEALKKAGGKPRYTEFPDRGHGMGQPNLTDEAVQWFFGQKRER